jgi:predicted small metal-binding protein
MLIRYSCMDMGLSCHFMVKGETAEEVAQKALEHIQEKHSDEFNNITTPAQIENMLKVLARSTRVVPG